ncbi:MAG: hypothetical protein R3C11_16890 [Planctomycetaceae bacterium]
MDERYDIIRMVRDKKYKYIRNYEPWKPILEYVGYLERGATMTNLENCSWLANFHQKSKSSSLIPKPSKNFTIASVITKFTTWQVAGV